MALRSVVVGAPISEASFFCFFAHGLGDTPDGFAQLAQHVWLPGVRATGSPLASKVSFVLPAAPERPITVNGGMKMPGWYDIFEFARSDNPRETKQDTDGINESIDLLEELVKSATKGLIDRGEVSDEAGARKRIIIGGFSQGGVVSLASLNREGPPFAGIIGASTFVGLLNEMKVPESKKDTPIFAVHGSNDPLIPIDLAKACYRELRDVHGMSDITFSSFSGAHEMPIDVAQHIGTFINKEVVRAGEESKKKSEL
jgi:predicted esterase